MIAAGFMLFVLALVWLGKLPLALLWLYLLASGVAFVVYAADKHAALHKRWRVRESSLHLLALLGGWPGALAAQRLMRHKSRKARFQLVFWGTVLLNCTILAGLFLPAGATVLAYLQALDAGS